MRKAVDLWIHLAHLALLLTAATLDGWRERGPTRDALWSARDVSSEARQLPDGPDVSCAMPVWRADANVRYAMLVARPQPVGDDLSPAADSPPCVNPYARFAASP